MNKKIIFFDIDGTIFSEKTFSIPESTKIALKLAKENGHLLFINTGRPYCEIEGFIKEVNFDGYICGCGTYIEYRGKELFHKSLGHELSKDIADTIIKCKLDSILEGHYNIYYDHDNNIVCNETKRIKKRHTELGFYKGLTLDDSSIEFDKFVMWRNESSNFIEFHKKYENLLEFIQRDTDFFEVVPLGFSKASGIKFLIDYLNISLEDTFAIGDSANDLSMLEYANTSIAMGNSDKSLFDLVSYVTTDIEEDGIYNALKHYKII